MFYHAMVAGGVEELRAKTFYAFVYAGGPRWIMIVSKNLEGSDETIVIPQHATIDPSTQNETIAWIQSTNPSLESIEKRLDARIVVR